MSLSNFRFIEKNIDVSRIKTQLLSNWSDWNAVSRLKKTGGDKDPYGFLPLTMAVVPDSTYNPKDSDLQENTPWYNNYTEITNWLKSYNIQHHSRAAFFRLPRGGSVGRHIDDGKYYLTRDRYHLSIQGTYLYEVDGEEHVIEPGTFFWFNNKKYHSAKNIGEIDRITFVFDVPHSSTNP